MTKNNCIFLGAYRIRLVDGRIRLDNLSLSPGVRKSSVYEEETILNLVDFVAGVLCSVLGIPIGDTFYPLVSLHTSMRIYPVVLRTGKHREDPILTVGCQEYKPCRGETQQLVFDLANLAKEAGTTRFDSIL